MLERMRVRTSIGVEARDEHRFDLAVEAAGSSSGFADSMRLAAPRGTVVLKAAIASRGSVDLTPAVINEVTVVGSRCGPFRPAIGALAAGRIQVGDLVDSVYPMGEYEEAFGGARSPGTLKVILKP